MRKLATRSVALKPSPLHTFFKKVKTAQVLLGGNVINLGVGEPDQGTPKIIKDAGIEAIRSEETKYTPSVGDYELRRTILFFLHEEGLEYNIESIVASAGAKPLLAAVLSIIVNNDGTQVIIPSPYYPPFYQLTCFFGGDPILVDMFQDNFQLTVENIERSISEHQAGLQRIPRVFPGVLILNSPNNPTGAVYSEENMRAIAELAKKYDLWVISDESYREFVISGEPQSSIAGFPGMKDRTIVIRALSKGYAMTGWRIGYAAGPEEVIGKVSLYLDNLLGCACSISQQAAITALNNPELTKLVSHPYMHFSRELLMRWVKSISVPFIEPSGAFYVFPDFSEKMSKLGLKGSIELAEYIFDNTGVAVTPGIAFGDRYDNYLRISYCVNGSKITEAVTRLSSLFK